MTASKVLIASVLAIVIIAIVLSLKTRPANQYGSAIGGLTTVASTTGISITTTSKQILATSTKRIAATIANVNCTVGGTLYVVDNLDAPATAGTGVAVTASTTQVFSDNYVPVSNNSVQAIVDVGTCRADITEWRPAY